MRSNNQAGPDGWYVLNSKRQLGLLRDMTSNMTASGVGIVHRTLSVLPRAIKLIVHVPP